MKPSNPLVLAGLSASLGGCALLVGFPDRTAATSAGGSGGTESTTSTASVGGQGGASAASSSTSSSSTTSSTSTTTAATSASSSGGTGGGGPTTYCASLRVWPAFCDDFESGTLASWAASMPDGFQGTNDSNAGKPPSLRSLSLANANSAPTNV